MGFVGTLCVALAVATLVATPARAWYIPGVSPVSYIKGQPIVIKVNSLTSNQGVIPYPFYSFKQCQPPEDRLKLERKKENIGEILWGDQIEPSEFVAAMRENITCRALCNPITYDKKDIDLVIKRIEDRYRGNLVLDNLPVAQEVRAGPLQPKVMIGYPLGIPKKFNKATGTTLLNNHLEFTIGYHIPVVQEYAEESYRIVTFYVSAHSIKHGDDTCSPAKELNPGDMSPQPAEAGAIKWTYSVKWVEEPDVAWATRWDIYLRGGDGDAKVHWLAILNSLLVVLFLAGMVLMIMMRALHKDFNRYNDPNNANEAQEETGWKLVHADVFRTPSSPVILAALVGSGNQLINMTVITLVFAVLGFLSPSNRGGLLTALILLFVLLGSYAGYTSARLLKYFRRQAWKNTFLTGILLPGTCIAIYLGINFIQWGKQASSAVPFKTLMLLIGLWFCVSLPLVFIGSVIGYKRPVIEVPCRVNDLPRFIPEQQWYLQTWFIVLVGGVLPFGAAFIELVYILSSFWLGRIYYVFGFLALVVFIVCITCALISVVLVYFQLCYDDYRWWWRSFLLCASSGMYLFLYSVYYLLTALSIRETTSVMVYLGYMGMLSYLFAVFTGTVGFLSAFAFVRKIYGSIKID